MITKTKLIIFVLITPLLSACATPKIKYSKNYNKRIKKIKKVAIIPPIFDVYKIKASETVEKIDKLTEIAKNKLIILFIRELKKRKLNSLRSINFENLNRKLKRNQKDSIAIFKLVTKSIINHYQRFEEVKEFDYTLGKDVAELTKIQKADALLFIYGLGAVSSSGRDVLRSVRLIVGLLMGGIWYSPSSLTFLNIALVDGESGKILWFATNLGDHTHIDPTDQNDLSELIKDMLGIFPKIEE